MSICYKIKEHLVMENTAGHELAVKLLQNIRDRLSEENVEHCDLTLTVAGTTKSYEGAEAVSALHAAAETAGDMELTMNYERDEAFEDDALVLKEMDALTSVMKENPASMDGAFYSVYAESDSSNEPCGLYAFGMKNGCRYAGKVAERKVNLSEVPDDAEWHSVGTASMLTCEAEETDFDRAVAEKICRQLSRMSEYDQLTNTEKEFSFFLNNYCAKSSQDLLDFLRLSRELSMLTGGVGTEEWLVDQSGADARLLRISDDAWGGGVFYLTSV